MGQRNAPDTFDVLSSRSKSSFPDWTSASILRSLHFKPISDRNDEVYIHPKYPNIRYRKYVDKEAGRYGEREKTWYRLMDCAEYPIYAEA